MRDMLDHIPPRARMVFVVPAVEPFASRHPHLVEAWTIAVGVLAITGAVAVLCGGAFIIDLFLYPPT